MLIDRYIQVDRHLETYWRGLNFFGRNSASHKFAFAKSLISLRPSAGDVLRLEDIAPVYAQALIQHLKGSPKQGTSKTSKFIDALRRYGVEEPDQSKLIEATVKYVQVISTFDEKR
jgi:hypothetical protein